MKYEKFDNVEISLTSLWCLLNVLFYDCLIYNFPAKFSAEIENAKFHLDKAIEILNDLKEGD